ncbi:hypothetical protein OPV22_014474 [Ensete ventricosum]|uniref:Uncharacterized protein n=1 Tax=Ensete ventricosum TaxID=4639 RepID=A0AAV8R3C3_ENSVE|nr:hypothetical protein OPV22_014474 [Ensete ventricosum]
MKCLLYYLNRPRYITVLFCAPPPSSRRNPNPESPPKFLDEQLVLAPATTRHSAATDAALSAQERDSKAPLVSALAAAASRSEFAILP